MNHLADATISSNAKPPNFHHRTIVNLSDYHLTESESSVRSEAEVLGHPLLDFGSNVHVPTNCLCQLQINGHAGARFTYLAIKFLYASISDFVLIYQETHCAFSCGVVIFNRGWKSITGILFS